MNSHELWEGKRCMAFQTDNQARRSRYGYCIKTAHHNGPHEVPDPDYDFTKDKFLTWESK